MQLQKHQKQPHSDAMPLKHDACISTSRFWMQTSSVLSKLAECISDTDKAVRAALLELLSNAVLPKMRGAPLGPFLPLIMAHLSSALTSLTESVRCQFMTPEVLFISPCQGFMSLTMSLILLAHLAKAFLSLPLSGAVCHAAALRCRADAQKLILNGDVVVDQPTPAKSTAQIWPSLFNCANPVGHMCQFWQLSARGQCKSNHWTLLDRLSRGTRYRTSSTHPSCMHPLWHRSSLRSAVTDVIFAIAQVASKAGQQGHHEATKLACVASVALLRIPSPSHANTQASDPLPKVALPAGMMR